MYVYMCLCVCLCVVSLFVCDCVWVHFSLYSSLISYSLVLSHQWPWSKASATGTLVASLQGAYHRKASASTGWPGDSVLWLKDWSATSISVAACTIVQADPSLRYTLACGWNVKQPTANNNSSISFFFPLLLMCLKHYTIPSSIFIQHTTQHISPVEQALGLCQFLRCVAATRHSLWEEEREPSFALLWGDLWPLSRVDGSHLMCGMSHCLALKSLQMDRQNIINSAQQWRMRSTLKCSQMWRGVPDKDDVQCLRCSR